MGPSRPLVAVAIECCVFPRPRLHPSSARDVTQSSPCSKTKYEIKYRYVEENARLLGFPTSSMYQQLRRSSLLSASRKAPLPTRRGRKQKKTLKASDAFVFHPRQTHYDIHKGPFKTPSTPLSHHKTIARKRCGYKVFGLTCTWPPPCRSQRQKKPDGLVAMSSSIIYASFYALLVDAIFFRGPLSLSLLTSFDPDFEAVLMVIEYWFSVALLVRKSKSAPLHYSMLSYRSQTSRVK